MVGHRKEVGIEFQGEGVFAWTRRERGGKRHDPCKHGRLATSTTSLNTIQQNPFLASQDALEVMRVSHSLHYGAIHSIRAFKSFEK